MSDLCSNPLTHLAQVAHTGNGLALLHGVRNQPVSGVDAGGGAGGAAARATGAAGDNGAAGGAAAISSLSAVCEPTALPVEITAIPLNLSINVSLSYCPFCGIFHIASERASLDFSS